VHIFLIIDDVPNKRLRCTFLYLKVMKLAGEKNFVEIERNFCNGNIKTITAYYGNLIKKKVKKVPKS